MTREQVIRFLVMMALFFSAAFIALAAVGSFV